MSLSGRVKGDEIDKERERIRRESAGLPGKLRKSVTAPEHFESVRRDERRPCDAVTALCDLPRYTLYCDKSRLHFKPLNVPREIVYISRNMPVIRFWTMWQMSTEVRAHHRKQKRLALRVKRLAETQALNVCQCVCLCGHALTSWWLSNVPTRIEISDICGDPYRKNMLFFHKTWKKKFK